MNHVITKYFPFVWFENAEIIIYILGICRQEIIKMIETDLLLICWVSMQVCNEL